MTDDHDAGAKKVYTRVMFVLIDRLLNKVTMYRLVLYVLIGWLSVAAGLGFFDQLQFTGWQIIATTLFFVVACWMTNRVFALAFHASAHDDSAYITALILSLIITPYRREADLPLIMWAPILAMSVKYIIARHRQHFFNPAAAAVVITGLTLAKSASWWVGTADMFWPVFIGGFLVIRKIRRFDVVSVYVTITLITSVVYGLSRGSDIVAISRQVFLHSPLLFFSAIMLTEPATMPPTHRWRLLYGACIGLLSAPFIHIGTFYFTPEVALVTGNALGWIVTRRERFILTVREHIHIAPTITDIVFDGMRLPSFQAGQYLEWNVAHHHPDGRGTRRYFTIASSPTESGLRIGIKKYQPMSTYKQALLQMQPGESIVAEQIDGDFVLPKNLQQPLVFIAGGIGITPFRSMLKYLLDKKVVRPITLFYANQVESDIVYTDILNQAVAELGLRTVYLLSDQSKIPESWSGQRGYISAEMIKKFTPNFAEAKYYLSGPQGMVTAYVKMLKKLGIKNSQIVTDYFPGFA